MGGGFFWTLADGSPEVKDRFFSKNKLGGRAEDPAATMRPGFLCLKFFCFSMVILGTYNSDRENLKEKNLFLL